jgi:predicted DNA-binding protein YlxM (UPF0122 family)
MLDESELRHLYLEEQRSIRNIATLLQVSTHTIYSALISYHIPRRASGFRWPRDQSITAPFDEATLRRLYLDEERSIRNIAARYQVSTRMVYEALGRYGIPRRTTGHRRPSAMVIAVTDGSIDEATLRRMYEEDGQSIAAIAASVSCAPSRIRNALVRWGIPRRRRGRKDHTAPDQAKRASLV